MIVNSGKDIIKQTFSGQMGAIGDTMVFGTGTTAETLTDTALEAQVYSAKLDSINADLANSRIVFKATIPAGMFASFTEIGILNNGTLVSRKVVAEETVNQNLPTEVEYSMGITIG